MSVCEDIQSLLLSKHLPDGTNYAVDIYNETIGTIIDKHAPSTTRNVTVLPHTPWYNDTIRSHIFSRYWLGINIGLRVEAVLFLSEEASPSL